MTMIQTLFDATDPRRDAMCLRDMVAETVLKIVPEPGFENVERLAAPMRETRTVLGLKWYPFGVGLDWDGTLNRSGVGYDDARPAEDIGPLDIVFFAIGQPFKTIREVGWDATRRSLDQGRPIVTTCICRDGVEYAQTAFAWSPGMDSARDMEIVLRWRMTNLDNRPRKYGIAAFANPRHPRRLKRLTGTLAARAHGEIWLTLAYRNGAQKRELTTLPGYPYTGKLFGTWNIRPVLRRLSTARGGRRLEECRRFWDAELAAGLKVRTPERRVNEAFRAWQAYNYINTRSVKFKGRIADMPHDGTGFYGSVYGITALSLSHALILCGRFEQARHVLESLMPLQRAGGLFMERYGLCDNGFFIFVISCLARYSGDAAWLRRVLPRARKAAEWILANRNRRGADRGKIEYGLLKGQYTADRTAGDYCYLSDAYNWLGLSELSRALAGIGRGAESRKWGCEAEAYRRDIIASMRRAAFPERDLFPAGSDYAPRSFGWQYRRLCRKSDLTVVPMTPVSRALEREFIGSHYYAIVANEVLETGILDVADPLYRHIVTLMEQRGGLLMSMVRWCDFVGIDHAYTYGYWLNKLREGDRGKVLLGFYGMLAYGMDRDTYAGTEITDLVTGRPHYGGRFHYQPHTLSNTQQIRILRMMLVHEEGDTLSLAPGAPRSWMTDLAVEDAVTPWGTLSFVVRPEGASLRARLDWRRGGVPGPRGIRFHLRDPQGRSWRAVEVNGRPWRSFDAARETVVLPGRIKQPVEITVRF